MTFGTSRNGSEHYLPGFLIWRKLDGHFLAGLPTSPKFCRSPRAPFLMSLKSSDNFAPSFMICRKWTKGFPVDYRTSPKCKRDFRADFGKWQKLPRSSLTGLWTTPKEFENCLGLFATCLKPIENCPADWQTSRNRSPKARSLLWTSLNRLPGNGPAVS